MMKKIVMTYGLAGAIVMMFGVMLPFWIWGNDMEIGNGEIFGYLSMILALSSIYFGIRKYKSELNDPLSFKQAFVFGTWVSFVAAVAFGVFSFVLYAWIMPDFLQTYLDHSIALVTSNPELSSKEVEAELSYIHTNQSLWLHPGFNGLLMFGTVLPIGLMMTTIFAWVLKDK